MAKIPEGIPDNAAMVYKYNTYFMKDEKWDEWFSKEYLKKNKGFSFEEFKNQVSILTDIRERHDEITTDVLESLLAENPDLLKIILIVLDISDEYFKRVITFLRNEGEGSSWMKEGSSSEWSINKIKTKIKRDSEFRRDISELFLRGNENPLLKEYLPKWHLSRFSKENLFFESKGIVDRICKSHLDGSRNAKKGNIPEFTIGERLKEENIPYYRGEKKLGLFDEEDPEEEPQWDFFIPNDKEPKIIIEVSFIQTTASGMNRKMRDIGSANREIKQSDEYSDISVVAFIDGVGWIARGESALKSWGNGVDEIFTTHPEELNRFVDFVKKKLNKSGIKIKEQSKLEV